MDEAKKGILEGLIASVNDFQIYVGNLSRETTDSELYEYFLKEDEHVINAKVYNLPMSSGATCFGFVQLSSDEFAYKLVARMQALARTKRLRGSPIIVREAYRRSRAEIERGVDYLVNTVIFVGNLNMVVGEEPVRSAFSKFGYVESVTVIPNKGFGFVKFSKHVSALAALSEMQNVELFHQRIYSSWGRIRGESNEVEDDLDEVHKRRRILDDDSKEDFLASMLPTNVPLPAQSVLDLHTELKKSLQAMGAINKGEEEDIKSAVKQANKEYIRIRMLQYISQQIS